MDQQTIDMIVRKVLEALGGAPVVEQPRTPAAGLNAGLAAGEFTAAGNPVLTRPVSRKSTPATPTKPGKVFITAEMLRGRMDAEGAKVLLTPNEHLTPAAEDLAEQKHLMIVRDQEEPGEPNPGADAAPALTPAGPAANVGALGIVTDRADAKVSGALGALKHDGIATCDYTATDCWVRNTRSLAEAIGRGELAAGVAVLPYAAGAMTLAGAVPGVRPVQGTRTDSVAAAMRQFDANLLVIGHSVATFHEIRSMVRQFADPTGRDQRDRVLLATLAELEGRP